MADPEIGFVDAEFEDVPSYAHRPRLNANDDETYLVDDGTTQVVGGAIQCALDGGTFEIAMYDITDGVDGAASRVFLEELTLPERPLDGEDGYEFDTYTFEIDPVSLREYVGRELAVAVNHDSNRRWGHGYPKDRETFYRGTDDPGLADPWQGELEVDTPVSVGLFVEPVEIPDDKKRTIVGDDVFDDRGQTVFAAFPERTPESGMAVQYDEQTTAGAPVTVLPNGVIEVGGGSSETDSFDVDLMDRDGEWLGSRTVTLAEPADGVALTATDGTIASGEEEATLSMTVQNADRLVLDQLWTDWQVSVSGAGSASTDNSVSETGEFELAWETVQSVVDPSVTITPPADTYVGGTYAVEIRAEGTESSTTTTAMIDIEPDQQSVAGASDDQTTIVADRAVDGSRLTSRPDGPVYHTSDGTVHLFTWDDPGPGARAVLYDEDDSTDWGGGPDVHVYDTMERPDAEAGTTPSRLATDGKWASGTTAELRPNSHSGDFSARVQNQDTSHKFKARFEETTEVFLSYCLKIPEGKAMPGGEEPGDFPDRSTWKLAWISHDDWWDDDVDIVLPSWAASFSIGGNNLAPDISIDDATDPGWFLWGEWMRFSLWLECGEDPANDPGRIRWQVVSEGEQTKVVADGEDAIMSDGYPPYAWKRLNIPGWAQNKDVSGDNVEVLYDDIYLATGSDSNARVELTDAFTYEDSTRIQLCDVRSWSSNRVSANLRQGSLDSIQDAAIHLTTAEEVQAVSMEVN